MKIGEHVQQRVRIEIDNDVARFGLRCGKIRSKYSKNSFEIALARKR
jgi:hypothetical protein